MITSEIAAECMALLREASVPVVAANIACRLGLEGSRETQRRKVRAIIKHLRDNGAWIVAANSDGYWLTEDEQIWKDYNTHRSIDGKRIIGEAHKRKLRAGDGRQGMLFGASAYGLA